MLRCSYLFLADKTIWKGEKILTRITDREVKALQQIGYAPGKFFVLAFISHLKSTHVSHLRLSIQNDSAFAVTHHTELGFCHCSNSHSFSMSDSPVAKDKLYGMPHSVPEVQQLSLP